MTLPPYPPSRKRAKTMNESKPRASRCTTGLRVKAMSGVTSNHLAVPQHFTIWTLNHHHELLDYATSWPDIMRAVHEWTRAEA